MAIPELTPISTTSKTILPVNGSVIDVTMDILPFGIYVDPGYFNNEEIELFQKGASDQVAYVYKKLGGDVLDIEMVPEQVYAAYEEACLEYSYLVNIHQSKNILSNILGGTTGSFDESGQIREKLNEPDAGDNAALNDETNLNLKYPKFDFAYSRRVSEGISEEIGVGGHGTVYSGSFPVLSDQQDYDLQALLAADPRFDSTDPAYIGVDIDNNKILIRKVYHKTPYSGWSFYGMGGGISVLGNFSSYGQYADDSTFNMVPAWQNKGQAMAYEDALRVRHSHWSYKIANNYLRVFPAPGANPPTKMWVEFTIGQDTWLESPEGDRNIGVSGINNMNTIPFENVPYKNINAIGKQWIRRFALALSKEILGLIRSKFASIPIPGNDIQLNGTDLVTAGKEEQTALRDELKEILNELTYGKLMEGDAEMVENSNRVQAVIPLPIFSG